MQSYHMPGRQNGIGTRRLISNEELINGAIDAYFYQELIKIQKNVFVTKFNKNLVCRDLS